MNVELVDSRILLRLNISSYVVNSEDRLDFRKEGNHTVELFISNQYPKIPPYIVIPKPILFHPNVDPLTGELSIPGWQPYMSIEDVISKLWQMYSHEEEGVQLTQEAVKNWKALRHIEEGAFPNNSIDSHQPNYSRDYRDVQELPISSNSFTIKSRRAFEPQFRNFPDEHSSSGYRVVYSSSEDLHNSANNPFRVRIRRDTFQKILRHAEGDIHSERFGILIGNAYKDSISYWVEILDMYPARRVDSSLAHVEVSVQELIRLYELLENNSEEGLERQVGWYHTHPGHGIFMSSVDRQNQALCYNSIWQLAMVVDPVNKIFGLYSSSPPIAVDSSKVILFSQAVSMTQSNAQDYPVALNHLVTQEKLSNPSTLSSNKRVSNNFDGRHIELSTVLSSLRMLFQKIHYVLQKRRKNHQ